MITRPVVSMSLGLEIFIHFFLSTLRLPSGSGHGVLRLLRSRVRTVGHPMERRPFRKCPPQERPRPGTHPLRQGEYENFIQKCIIISKRETTAEELQKQLPFFYIADTLLSVPCVFRPGLL